MKVLHKDLKHGEIKLVPENLDDIWHIYNIIEEGDLVRAVDFRTEGKQDDKIRSKKSAKKRMKLGIRVNEVKFHQFSDRLRVQGVIEEGPQDLGSFHTFNIEAEKMDKISIVKENWKDHHLERIQEAVRLRKQPVLTMLCMDNDAATIAVLRHSGVQLITEVDSYRSGKMYETSDSMKEFFGEILSIIERYKKSGTTLVIVGPGFAKENFVKFGKQKNPQLFDKYIVHDTGNTGMPGIQEAIKTGIVKQITKENRLVFETKKIEDLFHEIKKEGLATYGQKQVKYALENGAVERLLITDNLARTNEGEKLLNLAKENNSKFTIVNTMHESGEKLEGIGGAAALLRFKI